MLEPIGIYGALKLGGEKLVIAYNQVFDLPYTILRPSALYGPRCVSRRVSQAFIESAIVGDTLRVDGEGDERIDAEKVIAGDRQHLGEREDRHQARPELRPQEIAQ